MRKMDQIDEPIPDQSDCNMTRWKTSETLGTSGWGGAAPSCAGGRVGGCSSISQLWGLIGLRERSANISRLAAPPTARPNRSQLRLPACTNNASRSPPLLTSPQPASPSPPNWPIGLELCRWRESAAERAVWASGDDDVASDIPETGFTARIEGR